MTPIRRAVPFLPLLALTGLIAGVGFGFQDPLWRPRIWFVVLTVTGTVVVVRTVRNALLGQWAADIIATLAIVTSIVMDAPLPGLIVVIMQTGGEALERFAEGRASAAVQALEADRPQRAHVIRSDHVIDVAATDVMVGELVIVRPGELVPCDGVVMDGKSELDTARLTGEPVPEPITKGSRVRSGSINGNRPFTITVTAIANESQYARIVKLVREAQEAKAPFQRLADRYAVWFTPLTLVVAGMAALLSKDPQRFLAVLVVATPCPLILAPPIAIIGGINRGARRQIIVRNGTAVERLASVDVAVFDKTGTLTIGEPRVSQVVPYAPFTRTTVLEYAGAVEQGSSHLLARTLVTAAVAEVTLPQTTEILESAGQGVSGRIGNDVVAVGSPGFVSERLTDQNAHTLQEAEQGSASGGLRAYVAVNGALAGIVVYADQLRTDARQVLQTLGTLGVRRTVLLSGDRTANVRAIAQQLGISEARGELTPDDKVVAIRELVAGGHTVLMIGDGTNDAPALSAASVGVALAGHGGGVTAEAADVVVLVDQLDRIPDAIRLSRRTMRIATQSILAGLGLSGIAMGVAAFGYIAPTVGAVLQEMIDVAVIVNALRASLAPRSS